MSTEVHAQPDLIHAVADRLAAVGHELADRMDELSRDALDVMSSGWTGAAAESHRLLWSEWADSARSVVSALLADADLVRRAAHGYTATDNASASCVLTLGEHR